jgi:hypothetical protein
MGALGSDTDLADDECPNNCCGGCKQDTPGDAGTARCGVFTLCAGIRARRAAELAADSYLAGPVTDWILGAGQRGQLNELLTQSLSSVVLELACAHDVLHP